MIISVSITVSSEQIVSGIPRFATITTNIPATIFYTTDGSIPTISSNIYTSQLALPTNQSVVILQVYATDGINSSPIITNTYQTYLQGTDTRFPHSGVDVPVNSFTPIDPYPFGTNPIQPEGNYLGPAAAGYTTDDPSLPQTATGFNAFGIPDGYTNEPLIGVPTKTLPIIYSESNAEGLEGPGIGTIPRSTIVPSTPPPEQTFVGSPLFDPRAMVIYQDLTKTADPTLPPFINRMHFSLEDVDHTRTGNQYFNTALDAPPVSGTFLRQHYNPSDNTMNYYYLDTWQNRWIIVKAPAEPNPINNYWGSTVNSSNQGAGFVFQWLVFKANYLY